MQVTLYEQVIFRNTCIPTYMHTITEKKPTNFKESWEGYMGEPGRKKRKEEML